MQRRASREMELDGICRGIWRGVSILSAAPLCRSPGPARGRQVSTCGCVPGSRRRLWPLAVAWGRAFMCSRGASLWMVAAAFTCPGTTATIGTPFGPHGHPSPPLPSVKVSPAESHLRSWTSIHFHILQTCAPILMDTLSSRARWCGGNTSACTALPSSGARTGLMCLTIS
jgi:hypothetical protein